MPKKIEIQEIKSLLSEMYPDQIFDLTSYKNTSSKIKLLDPIYGEWFPTVHNLLSKKRQHTKRASRRIRITIEIAIERTKKAHGDSVVIDKTTYSGVNYKCKFIDKEYGEFWARPCHVFRGMRHKKRAIHENGVLSRLSIEEVKNRLKENGREITIDESTYSGLYRKAKFIHAEYGEWWAAPNNVISNHSSHPSGAKTKSVNTSMKKYGTKNPMQNREIFLKASVSRWHKISIKHWKSGNDVVCTSSYEYAVATYLNENKIDYEWQIKFVLPDKHVYFVDLYLVKDNKYIELKGIFWTEKNKIKWETFHALYKSSEIWFIGKIVSLVKKTEYKIKKEFRDAHRRKKD